tara:strand:+ start:4916 stop:5905 length:990 start_codon:yes stop_codon:yes gene_type:complete
MGQIFSFGKKYPTIVGTRVEKIILEIESKRLLLAIITNYKSKNVENWRIYVENQHIVDSENDPNNENFTFSEFDAYLKRNKIFENNFDWYKDEEQSSRDKRFEIMKLLWDDFGKNTDETISVQEIADKLGVNLNEDEKRNIDSIKSNLPLFIESSSIHYVDGNINLIGRILEYQALSDIPIIESEVNLYDTDTTKGDEEKSSWALTTSQDLILLDGGIGYNANGNFVAQSLNNNVNVKIEVLRVITSMQVQLVVTFNQIVEDMEIDTVVEYTSPEYANNIVNFTAEKTYKTVKLELELIEMDFDKEMICKFTNSQGVDIQTLPFRIQFS